MSYRVAADGKVDSKVRAPARWFTNVQRGKIYKVQVQIPVEGFFFDLVSLSRGCGRKVRAPARAVIDGFGAQG